MDDPEILEVEDDYYAFLNIPRDVSVQFSSYFITKITNFTIHEIILS